MANADCASQLCDLDAGTCFDESLLLYASPSGGSSDPCTLAAPCAITTAASRAAGDPVRNTIKLAAGTYSDPVTVSGGTVTIFGESATASLCAGFSVQSATLRLRNLGLLPAGSISGGPTSSGAPRPVLDLDGIAWTGASGNETISALPGILTIRRSRFVCTNLATCSAILYVDGSYGVANGSAEVTIDQTTFSGGDPIMDLGLSTVTITNSVFANAGPTYGAWQFSTAPHIPTFSSVSLSTFYNARVICPNGTTGVVMDSNLILNQAAGAPADSVAGSECSHSYELIEPQSTNPGGTGNLLGMDPKLVDAANGDFHLMSNSPAINAGDPTSAVTHDYDGTARPQGARNDIGAFEYH
jgi:hypothetical protein